MTTTEWAQTAARLEAHAHPCPWCGQRPTATYQFGATETRMDRMQLACVSCASASVRGFVLEEYTESSTRHWTPDDVSRRMARIANDRAETRLLARWNAMTGGTR